MIETSLIWIKPDVFYDKSILREEWSELNIDLPLPTVFIFRIIDEINNRWLVILNQKSYIVPGEIARDHYAEHKWKFDENYQEYKQDFLVRYLTSWLSHWIIFSWEKAIVQWREIIKSIRELYLVTPNLARYNMTHASDSEVAANREIELHFPDFEILR